MNNKKMLIQAIEFLKDVSADKVESIQIENNSYDDGSNRLTIDVTFLPKAEKPYAAKGRAPLFSNEENEKAVEEALRNYKESKK
ncbi:hypothetical protein [Heyndrickxia ginsengihumi]|nr:hypothetical protein [Heyndrickxia ginsengihumi]